jgi:hypothetical protein
MNIGYGKFGKSILFNEKSWPAEGVGVQEAPFHLITLAKYNPDINFYLLSRSDFQKLDRKTKKVLFPNDNVFEVWQHLDTDDPNEKFKHPYNYLKKNNIKLDTAIMYAGPAGSRTNVVNMIKQVKDPTQYAKTLCAYENYTGPLFYFLNMSKIPYMVVLTDQRYFPLTGKDLFHNPDRILSQINLGPLQRSHMISYENQECMETTVTAKYAGIEKGILIDWDKRDITKLEKTKDILILLNQAGANNNRAALIKEYILENFENVEIYGKWDEKFYEDSRFKGPLYVNDLRPVLDQSRYSILFSINKCGWLTQKIYEFINSGIIPFLHKDYDNQNNFDIPENLRKFLRLSGPQDFINKINYLKNNPEKEDIIRKTLQECCLKDEYYTGEFINDSIMSNLFDMLNKDEYERNMTYEELKKIIKKRKPRTLI